jgi:hypothetical protein
VNNRPITLVDPLGLYSRTACVLTWTLSFAAIGARMGAATGATGGVVVAGAGAVPGAAAGATVGGLGGAAVGAITGMLVCPPDSNCSANQDTEAGRCQREKRRCVSECTRKTIPTGTLDGAPFYRCVRNCMDAAGCYGN